MNGAGLVLVALTTLFLSLDGSCVHGMVVALTSFVFGAPCVWCRIFSTGALAIWAPASLQYAGKCGLLVLCDRLDW